MIISSLYKKYKEKLCVILMKRLSKKLLKKKRREVSESFSGSSRRRLIKEDPWTVCVMREGLRPVHPAY
jgi:hypothetical protein